MKDYKAEFDKLRGELASTKRELERLQNQEQIRFEREEDRKEEVRRIFRDLLLDVLGR